MGRVPSSHTFRSSLGQHLRFTGSVCEWPERIPYPLTVRRTTAIGHAAHARDAVRTLGEEVGARENPIVIRCTVNSSMP
jgi:hypothetical protein